MNSPLKDYKELMSEANYNAYDRARAYGQKTWYSHNMTKEAAVYILAWAQIESGRVQASKEVQEAKQRGQKWTDAKKKIDI